MPLRIGIAGQRGAAFATALRLQPETELTALCNIDPETLQRQGDALEIPHRFTSFLEMLEAVDAVVVSTPMQLHAAQSIAALNAGKHVMSEVTACVTLEECWRLRDAALKAADRGIVYAMAENYCYLQSNVLIREMCRKGLFGTIYFGEGEYLHEVRNLHHYPDGSPTWRYYWQVGTPGSTYPTHSLGPVMQWFKAVDPEERIEGVVCLGTGIRTDPEHPHDDTTILLCRLRSGKLVKVRVDMMSNRPHQMAYYALQGTGGVYETSRFDGSGRIWIGESRDGDHREWRPLSDFDEHLPDDRRNPPDAALKAGHGGGDFFVARDFVRACRGEQLPATDIFEALEWTAAGLCSTISLQNGGVPIRLPDFRNPAERPLTLDAPPVLVD
ncbi:MAG: Gfo/Idh/MocA family oxidoreductase [Capsulimonadales bacterium]|nr:Gfo/Idh/MocA family oxidoreductase [Capsulimonadales bacterium]